MRFGAVVARSVWLGYWNTMRKYHRYEVMGVEHLEHPGSALIVGYHGRPGARDLCMLQTFLLERSGAITHAVAHQTAWEIPFLRAAAEGMEFLPGDGDDFAAAVGRGEKIIVTPGGTREANRSFREKNKVRWGERVGYLRLAIKYGLPIIPTAAAGADDAFIGLVDGYELGKRLSLSASSPIWVGVGPGGFWPMSPPFPAKVTQHVAEPIDLAREGCTDSNDREKLLSVHRKVIHIVQGLLDGAQPSGHSEQVKSIREELMWVDQLMEEG